MLLITALDDIAWLLNLRGNDIEFNPLFFSYALFTTNDERNEFKVDLFINQDKVADILGYLQENNIEVHDYNAIGQSIEALSGQENKSIQIDDTTSFWLYDLLDKHDFKIRHQQHFVPYIKCKKNPV